MKPIIKLQKEPDKVFKSDDGSTVTLPGQNIPEPVFDKINELVDAVNKLQKDYDNVCIWVGEQKLKKDTAEKPDVSKMKNNNNPNPYAWIGKLCRFRKCEEQKWKYGILKDVIYDTSGCLVDIRYRIGNTEVCECEPVKPDDDIIYKGE